MGSVNRHPITSSRLTPAAALLIAGVACVLPFLLPEHHHPLPSFQAEWLAIALWSTSAAIVCLAVTCRTATLSAAPSISAGMFALTGFIGLQAIVMHPPYLSVPVLAILYVVFASTCAWLGSQLTHHAGLTRLANTVAWCVLLGALLSALAAIIQFIGIPDWLQDFVSGHTGGRAYGNIAQANLLANYLAAGEASLAYLWTKKNLRPSFAIGVCIFLSVASALTGARIALIFSVSFLVLGVWLARTQPGQPGRNTYAVTGLIGLLVSIFAMTLSALPIGTADPLIAGAGELTRLVEGGRLRDEPRWQAWLLAWRLFAESPLLGHGWGSFAGAVFTHNAPAAMMRFGDIWTSAHNLLLHLLAETGLIGTGIVLASLALWGRDFFTTIRAERSPESVWIFAWVLLQAVHSLVEFPLWSAHFLGPTLFLMGAGVAASATRQVLIRRDLTVAASVLMAIFAGLALSAKDFVRLNIHGITGASLVVASRETVDESHQAILELSRGILSAAAEISLLSGHPVERVPSQDMIELSERVLWIWPSHLNMIKRSIMLAHAGRIADAVALIEQSLRALPARCGRTRFILTRARDANPAAIDPLLARLPPASVSCLANGV